MRIRSILLFLIFMMVSANLSVALDSPLIHNFSNSSTMLPKITKMEGPGGITHRLPPNISIGDIRPGRLNNLSSNKNIYLFSWDDIPGNDTVRLIKILRYVFRIEWAETATIEKIDNDMTIRVSTETNYILLKLNDDKTMINLTINNGRTDEFNVRMENNKFNIYKHLGNSAQAGLFSKNTSTSMDQPRLYSTATATTTGPVHNINNGTTYTTIQAAINDASPGDEIHVDNGTYYENVNVNKRLILHGIEMPVVDAGGSGSAITLAADGIRLEGFTATGGGEAGIKVISNNNTLINNNASNNGGGWGSSSIGIFLSSSSNNTLTGNNASANYVYYGVATGIYLYSSSNNTLTGNNANSNLGIKDYYSYGYGSGIWLESSTRNVLKNNIMKGNNYNFGLDGNSYSDFDNQIDPTNLVDGKSLYYMNGATNTVYDTDTNAGTFYCINCVNVTLKNLNLGSNLNGIFFWNTTRSKIQNVTASNNNYGISISFSSNNTLIGNNASSNYVYCGAAIGISLSLSSNNTLIGNNANSNSAFSDCYDEFGTSYSYSYGISLTSSSNNTLSGNSANSNSGSGRGPIGYGYGYGIFLSSSSNNNLSGNNANSNSGYGYGLDSFSLGEGYGYGILLSSSSNNTLNGNNANSNSGTGIAYSLSGIGYGYGHGISMSSSSNNTLNGNNASLNLGGVGEETWGGGYGYGISLSFSSKSVLKNNMMNGNNYNFGLEGSSHSDFDNYIYTTNLVNGKSVYYIKGEKDTVYDNNTNAGTFYCINCMNVTLKNLDLESNLNGIFFWNTTQSKIQNVTASYNGYGISLSSSSNNTLIGNNANSNHEYGFYNKGGTGISLSSSSNNTLIGNNANSNLGVFSDGTGISLSSSNNNTLIRNNANSNLGDLGNMGWGRSYGISLTSSDSNTLISNNANSNGVDGGSGYGISLSFSSNNMLIGNNVSLNHGYYFWEGIGISLSSSINNKIHHNNLIDNTNQASDDSTTNLWDNGYPSGGNYFSDYAGNDSNNDGIGDTPYNISAGAQDRYPLMARVTTGPVYNINKRINYTTIQAAIDDASPGDEIHVDSGSYLENMNINKKLTLRGIGMPVVDASGNGSVITLLANGITLEGFIAKGSSSNLEAGIKVKSNNNTLRGNNVSNNYFGIYLLSSSNNTLNGNSANLNNLGIFLNSSNFNNITGNNISNNTEGGIRIYNTSKNNTISGNKVTNSSSGIFFVYAFNTTAFNNIIENNTFNFGVGGNLRSHFEGNNIDTTNLANGKPIYYVKYGKNTIYDGSTKASTFYCILCDNVTVKDMEMSNMDRGIYFWETSNSRIQNLTVKESGWGAYLRFSSNNNTIRNSRFSTNNIRDYYETGVSVISSDNNTFENNTFISNNYGIELATSSKNTIYNNYFNNTNNVVFSGTPYVNTWNVTKKPGKNIIGGSYIGGNFWANPAGKGFSQTCLDGNNDGLCDLKYSLNTINVDYLPLTVPPKITVVSPNGTESWVRGTTKTIKWSSSGSPGSYVKIELLKPGVANKVIISSTLNDGSHSWLIPAAQLPGDDYKVKVTSTSNASYSDTSDNKFTILAPSFTVVSPNGGENWTRGTTKTIKWNSTESPGTYVKIELLKPGAANKVIISSTINDGSHPWLIPSTQLPGNDYKLKITSTINVSVNDTSDNTFIIPAPSFSVVSPNGGENWTRGTTQTIRWNSTESPGTYVKIELLKPGFANKLIISSTLNDGSHPWLIPATQLPGDDYKVKITSTINASVNDTSDNNFSIVLPKITVTSPNGGENWTRGTTHLITWNYTGNPGTYVKIELLKGGALNRTILSSTLNDKSQSWTIPSTQAINADYKIRITSTANTAYNDTSDSNFTIAVPII